MLRKALALKADEAVLVVNDAAANPDPLFVARALAAAIRKLGAFDVVLVGREAGDWGAGQTGGLLAEELGVPCISFAESIEPAAGRARSRSSGRPTAAGSCSKSATPLVVTITNHEKNVPRIPKTRDVMQSYRKPLTKWTLAELGVDPATANAYYEVAELFIPRKETQCEFIAGDTLEAKIDAFARPRDRSHAARCNPAIDKREATVADVVCCLFGRGRLRSRGARRAGRRPPAGR